MSADRFRSPDLLALAAGETCTIELDGCQHGPCVSAHSNQAKHGKGKSVKADDCFIAHACPFCHYEIDQGKNLTREEKFEAWERGHIKTLPRLFRALMQVQASRPKVKQHRGTALTSSKIVPRPWA